jgi:hypothetical protein
MQGRGKNCKVDCYKRNDLDYFFAYPEDYAQASIEWVGQEFKRRPFHPAFEVIFVYSQEDGKLDVYLTGDRKPVPDLQQIFAKAILKTEIEEDKKDERIYDLTPLRSRHFQFVYGPESGIEKIMVKKLRLGLYGKNKEKIMLETDALYDRNAIFDLYDKTTKDFLPSQIFINQVGIKATFAQNPSSRKAKSCTFTITWPNSCSLKHDGRHLILRKMLVDSGIEPREPAEEKEIA